MTPPEAGSARASSSSYWQAHGQRAARRGGGWRQVLGWSIVLGGLAACCHDIWQGWQHTHPALAQAWAAGWLAAVATALGTLPVCLAQTVSVRARDVMMGFGAGVMLAASVFSLIVPALGAASDIGIGDGARATLVGAGVLLGAALLMALERWLPHLHAIAPDSPPQGSSDGWRAERIRRVWLFVAAVALHNLPEGLAIGVAHGGTDAHRADALTTGIAIQDIPEGLVIASALMSAGYSRGVSVFLGALSGVVEPLGAVTAASMMTWSVWMLPWGLSIAAGAMLFVISHEIIPETHGQGHELVATSSLMIGFVLMMGLDTALG